MAGPPFGAPLQEFGAPLQEFGDGGSFPNSYNRSDDNGRAFGAGPVQEIGFDHDSDLDFLLSELQQPDQQNSAACLDGAHTNVNAFFSRTPAQTAVCNLQPRVYERSASLSLTYRHPPLERVVQLQLLPPDLPPPLRQQQADALIDSTASSSIPAHPLMLAPITPPTMPPHLPVAGGLASHIFSMPAAAHQPSAKMIDPPVYCFDFSTQDFSFDSPQDLITSWDVQLGDPAAVVAASSWRQDTPPATPSFPISDPHASYKLTDPHMMGHSEQQNFMNCTGPSTSSLNVCARHLTSCPTSAAASPSPAYTKSSYSNGDSAAMEVSSMSTPTSTSSGVYQFNSMSPDQRRGPPVPPSSPTPFVNKNVTHERSMHEDNCNGVKFRVKTEILNLYDGFTWKKYGEKKIKKTKHTRSYFRCDERNRSLCNVLKHTQRCTDDEEYAIFTYLGRHNHHP